MRGDAFCSFEAVGRWMVLDLDLSTRSTSAANAVVTAVGVGSTLGLDSVGVNGRAVAFNSFFSGGIFAVQRFLNKFASSGLTNGTESLL